MQNIFFQMNKGLASRSFWLLSAAMLLSLFHSNSVRAQTIQVELMASTTSWLDAEYTGHAFMCISVPVGTGIKEDCFGFYPRGNGIISGPGVVVPEIPRNPARFSRITVSIKRAITDEQRRQILKMVDEWNSKTFNLSHQSCIDFVNSIAQTVGWITPSRVATDLPETYLKKLAEANDPLIGKWEGSFISAIFPGERHIVKLEFTKAGNSYAGSITVIWSPTTTIVDPFTSVKLTSNSMEFTSRQNGDYKGTISDDFSKITGTVLSGTTPDGTFEVRRK